MTFSKITGGLLLLAALVPTTQATPSALRALQRNRRAGFCDAMQKGIACSQQQASSCTGDCMVSDGECSLNPAILASSFNMGAMLAPLLACGLGGMGGEQACNNAYAGGMCKWTTNDEGQPTCSVHADKLVAAMGGGDPVMNDMLTASVTCSQHGSQNHCSADSNCQYDGNSCGPNPMAFMSKCATSGGSNGGGSGAGDKCKGLTKMGDLYLPCAGKDKAACGAASAKCSYQEEDMQCTPSVASAMQALMSDKDVQAAQQYTMTAGSGCDTKAEAACQADAKCEAGLEQRKSMTNSCQNGVCTSSTQTTFAKTCEVNVPKMLGDSGCDGSVLAMYYRIKAGEQKVEARKAKAAKDKATADKPKLVEAATAKKAAYEEAKKAADACIDSTFGVDTTNNITAGACDQEKQAAATAKSESQAADAAVASNDATITSAASAATQFEADVVATEADAAEVATTAGESTTAAGESTTAASNDESPASRLVSSAAAVFAAAAAAAMAL